MYHELRKRGTSATERPMKSLDVIAVAVAAALRYFDYW